VLQPRLAQSPQPIPLELLVVLSGAKLERHHPVVCVGGVGRRVVALQVAFDRQTLKPVFHSIGVRLWV
jgi:hypothetical protein